MTHPAVPPPLATGKAAALARRASVVLATWAMAVAGLALPAGGQPEQPPAPEPAP